MVKRGTTEVKAEQAASDEVTEQTNIPAQGEPPEVKAEQAASERSDVPKFDKTQFLASNWYSHRRDILSVLLADDKTYSHAEVDKLIGEFMKGEVK